MKNTANDTKVLLREKRTKGVKEALKTITTYNSTLLGNLFYLFMYGISVDGQLLILLVQSHSLPFFILDFQQAKQLDFQLLEIPLSAKNITTYTQGIC